MWATVLGWLVWLVVLPVMTVMLGVPAALWVVIRQSKGAVLGFAGWVLGAGLGVLPVFGGPYGVPALVFWPLSAVFGLWWLWGFVVMSAVAWRRAVEVRTLMMVYGVPPEEIV